MAALVPQRSQDIGQPAGLAEERKEARIIIENDKTTEVDAALFDKLLRYRELAAWEPKPGHGEHVKELYLEQTRFLTFAMKILTMTQEEMAADEQKAVREMAAAWYTTVLPIRREFKPTFEGAQKLARLLKEENDIRYREFALTGWFGIDKDRTAKLKPITGVSVKPEPEGDQLDQKYLPTQEPMFEKSGGVFTRVIKKGVDRILNTAFGPGDDDEHWPVGF